MRTTKKEPSNYHKAMRAGEMAQQVKILATESGDLNLIPQPYMVE